MAKHTNKFVDRLKKGDKFYLAVYSRGYDDVWLGEVEFQTKTMRVEKSLYSEPRVRPFYVTEHYYTLKLKSGEERFSVTFRDSGWNGDTWCDSVNIEFSGADLLIPGFHIADCHMTTDREEFKRFVNEKRLLEQSIATLQKGKEAIERKLKKLFEFRSGTTE